MGHVPSAAGVLGGAGDAVIEPRGFRVHGPRDHVLSSLTQQILLYVVPGTVLKMDHVPAAGGVLGGACDAAIEH